jgi:hypothetical protein
MIDWIYGMVDLIKESPRKGEEKTGGEEGQGNVGRRCVSA